MPVKSRAQWDKMHALHKEGRLSKDKLSEMTHGVDYKKLPEHVKEEEGLPKVKRTPVEKPVKGHKVHKSWGSW